MSGDLSGRLEPMLGEAEAALQEASGAGAVCAFSRTGMHVPGIKYHEGRWAALKELSRLLRHFPKETTVAQEVQRDWSAALQRAADRAAGPDWIAYRQGGMDALADLLADGAPTAVHEAHGRSAPDGPESPPS